MLVCSLVWSESFLLYRRKRELSSEDNFISPFSYFVLISLIGSVKHYCWFSLSTDSNRTLIRLSGFQQKQRYHIKKADGVPSAFSYITINYSVIVATTPAPTVRPPSRIENLVPSSIAIGAISSTVISMLSPGITISTPSGRLQIPVISEVRK
jgi:hypothetical protein